MSEELQKYVPKKFTREEFHKKLWELSAKGLASELAVSESMITKICKRHDIPKPPAGFNTRKECGYQDSIARLPSNPWRDLDIIEIHEFDLDIFKKSFSEEGIELLNKENELLFKASTSKKAPEPSSFLEIKQQFKEARRFDNGLIIVSAGQIAFKVSPISFERMLTIIRYLLNGFEKRDYVLSSFRDEYHMVLNLRGIEIPFKIRELLKKRKIQSEKELHPSIRNS